MESGVMNDSLNLDSMNRREWMVRSLMAVSLMTGGSALGAGKDDRPDYDMTGEGASVEGLQPIRVEGIGLVTGLSGTGSEPPQNAYRRMMLEIMKKKGVEAPADVLRSHDNSIVLLRAYLPPGARKGDMIDVEVWVPPGDETSSLKGGFLLEAELKEQVITQGKHLKSKGALQGDTFMKVAGPVLVLPDKKDGKIEEASLKKGKVLGQGRILEDRNFRLVLEDGKKSQRRSRDVAFRINQRFKSGPNSKEIAKPVDHQRILLGLPAEYEQNIERYIHVVRRIPMSSSQTYHEQLLSFVEADLMNPEKTIEAALRLEAMGSNSIPSLKEGLLSDHELVRFCSAQSLAYMRDPSGYRVLGEMADKSNMYRSYALAALIAHDAPLARAHLNRLMSSESAEARYGAFRAMWMMDKADPTVKSVLLGPDQFSLHTVASTASPMTHLSRNFRREIVLFNPNQQLLPPLTLRAGEHIAITSSPGSDEVHLYSSRAGKGGTEEQRRISSTSVADIIRNAAELGASYPDIVDMLMQASQTGNLSARLEINALPRAPRLEVLEAVATSDGKEQWQSFNTSTPNLFDSGPEAVGPKLTNRLETSTPEIEGTPDRPQDEEGASTAETPATPKKRSFLNLMRRSAN
jgi:flagellar basal body P-ring protein FlgI